MEGGRGVIQDRAEGLAGREGKYVAWRSVRKEGEDGSRAGGAGRVEVESGLGRGGGGMEAGWRSGGGVEGGRSEAARRERSVVVPAEEEGLETVVVWVVELSVVSGISDDDDDDWVGGASGWGWPWTWGAGSGGSEIRLTASSSMFAFLNSRSISDELSPVSSSFLASSISSGDMFAIRCLFSSSMLCASVSSLDSTFLLERSAKVP